MLQDNNPDAACVYEIHKKGGEKEQCCILLRSNLKGNPSRITTALRELLHIFVGRAVNARRHVGSRQLCLLTCAVAL